MVVTAPVFALPCPLPIFSFLPHYAHRLQPIGETSRAMKIFHSDAYPLNLPTRHTFAIEKYCLRR